MAKKQPGLSRLLCGLEQRACRLTAKAKKAEQDTHLAGHDEWYFIISYINASFLKCIPMAHDDDDG